MGVFVEECLPPAAVSRSFEECLCSRGLWSAACCDLGLAAFWGSLTSEPVPASKNKTLKPAGTFIHTGFSDVDSRTCEYSAGLRALAPVRVGQREQLVDVVRLEEASLLWIFQNAVGQELFKDLPGV